MDISNAQAVALDWLWQTTWQTAILAATIGIITRIFRGRLSPGAVSLLWMLVFIRLIMPVLPGSPVSIFALFKHEPVPVQPAPIAIPMAAPSMRVVVPMRAIPPEPAPEPSRWIEQTLLAIWLIGTGLLIVHVSLATMRFARRLKQTAYSADPDTIGIVEECCHRRDIVPPPVLITDIVGTPAIFGAIRPKLLLPPAVLSQLSRDELRCVILHELEHVRRHHLLADWILTLIRSVHWFNPAAWWSHRQIRAARELICDQSVLSSLDEENSRAYGLTMLAMASGLKPTPAGVPIAAFAREQKLLRRRIEAIVSQRRYLAGLGVLLAILLGMIFLTTPSSTAQNPPAPAADGPKNAPTTSTARERYAQLDLDYKINIYERLFRAAPNTVSADLINKAKEDVNRARQQLEQVKAEAQASRATAAPADDQRNTAVRAALEKVLPELRFDGIGFDDVIEFLRDVTGTKIFVNGKAFEYAKIDRSAPVTARLRNVPFSKALELILTDVAGGAGKLAYVVDDGVIAISTVEDLKNAALKADAAAPGAQDPVIVAQLERVLPEVRFENIGLADVIDFLRDVSGANIFVNWKTLEAAGVDRNTPITARLRDVKFSKTLETILRDAGGGKVNLGYDLDRGVITISTADDLAANDLTRVYDIADLILLFREAPPERQKELKHAILTLITDTVARDSWVINGGKIGSIGELDGQLIVSQTPENHRNIAQLLTQLREARGVRIVMLAQLIDMPKARAAALGAPDPQTGCFIVDDAAIANFTGPDVRVLLAPKVTALHGQPASMTAAGEGISLDVVVASTVSANGNFVTMKMATGTRPTAAGRSDIIAIQPIPNAPVTIPTGATALRKLADAGPDREQWLAVKAEIVIRRAGESGFPLLGNRP